ncbi:MAG: NAD(P)/FAD-dependent oxidoreductase, partial [Halolamina sp.]
MDYCKSYIRELTTEDPNFTVHETGYLRVGTENERETFEREAAIYRDCGVDVEVVNAERMQEIEPALETEGLSVGTYVADDCHVDPHSMTTAILRRAEAAGVDYQPDTPVTDIGVDDGRVTGVTTPEGNVDADHVVVAGGPWSKRLCGFAGVTLPCRPYRVHALVTTEVDVAPMPIYDADSGAYFRAESGGVLLGDGSDETESDPDGYDATPDFSFLDTAAEVLERRLPLSDPGVVNAWVGCSSATPDGFPLIGGPPVTPGEEGGVDGLWVGAGLQGHGVMRAPIVGKLIADALCSGADHVAVPEYDPNRFDADPGEFTIDEMMKLDRP